MLSSPEDSNNLFFENKLNSFVSLSIKAKDNWEEEVSFISELFSSKVLKLIIEIVDIVKKGIFNKKEEHNFFS